ncbi:MAG: Asp-tRNA(Asn)/Glu-tRNA(Gln) amidotransferase subunit GatB [Cytophagales bacterium]|nr:Asp-tRNA(Asn)/Glu-tRNA(Gln) amidotransferase subunit GatB [Bernardetiaceae bacterium]MDW8204116.1 Asp-tRNA(Asn)/Glu-tRNA(Gln) amidotransferase subunit GatB [Cytophagales bacterium]
MSISETVLSQYELVVGLEVHVQLSSQSKIFAADANRFGDAPNTNVSVITLGHPGTLPMLNAAVVEMAIKMGLACHCDISRYNIFDRKNYFYPDLPKGFQITQEKTPICKGGYLDIRVRKGNSKNYWIKRIRLNRIHLEEDAGKSVHPPDADYTQIDLNRAGAPLIEMVTEPDIRQPEEAAAYLATIRRLVRYLGICDGNMEEGSMRCDANVSVRKKGNIRLGQKVEIKNMNSMRNVQRAIEYEFVRQVTLLEQGESIQAETRLFDVASGRTFAMRTKETLNDYRYFPEPDLAPFVVTDADLARIQAAMPQLPEALMERFQQQYQLPEYDAAVLTEERETALFFEQVCQLTKHYKAVSNWLMGPIKSYLNENGKTADAMPLTPSQLAEVVALTESGAISFSVAAKELLAALAYCPEAQVKEVARNLNLIQESNTDVLLPLIEGIVAKFPQEAAAYKKGKKKLIGMFMGEVMKAAPVKIDPKKADELLRQVLES